MIQKEDAGQRTAPEQIFAEREEDENRESGDEEHEEEELALWSPEVHVLELEKGERGLGFSVLDYQVCLSRSVFSKSKHTAFPQNSININVAGGNYKCIIQLISFSSR